MSQAPLITLLTLLNWPRLTGHLLRLKARPLRSSQRTPVKSEQKPGKSVLLLAKTGFTEDALCALETLGDVEIIRLRRYALKAVAALFLPAEVDDNNYASASSKAKAGMVRYRDFLSRMWETFDPERRIKAVVSGNFGYYAERDLAAALETLNVPFVALHKENLKSPGRAAFWERVYRERRGPFLGRRILVYNGIERDVQVRAGVADLERIEIVGMPRLDPVHHWREANAGAVPAPMVLFFSFLSYTGMPTIGRKGASKAERYHEALDEDSETIDVSRLCASVHQAAVELAVACPDISVIIKTKGRPRDRIELPRLLGSEGDLPANLRIIHGGPPHSLIYEAAAVCGFNSTTLLEAIAADRPLVTPDYFEALDPNVFPYVLDLGAAAQRADSQQDLVNKLKALARERRPVRRTLEPEAIQMLDHWVGNSDGRAGERTAAAFRRILEDGTAPSASLLEKEHRSPRVIRK